MITIESMTYCTISVPEVLNGVQILRQVSCCLNFYCVRCQLIEKFQTIKTENAKMKKKKQEQENCCSVPHKKTNT